MGQPVMQWQILSNDPEKMTEFYSQLFGWRMDADNAMGYRVIDTQSEHGINGGIWPAPPEGHASVMLYVEVDNMADYVAKASKMGAGIVIPPQKLPDGDEMAVISDPEGIPIGLMKSKRP
jgi:predicted enzyme related to lactoylglutathione lyase